MDSCKKGLAAMLAPFPATSSRTSRPTPEPIAAASSRSMDWGVRLVQVALAIYLLPVLFLIFLIGWTGIAITGAAVLAVKLARWGRRAYGVEDRDEDVHQVESPERTS